MSSSVMFVKPINFNLATPNLHISQGAFSLSLILPRSITVLLYTKVSAPSSAILKLSYFLRGYNISVPLCIPNLIISFFNIMVNLSYI